MSSLIFQGAAIHGSFLGFDLMGKKNGGNGGVIINTASLAGIIHSAIDFNFSRMQNFNKILSNVFFAQVSNPRLTHQFTLQQSPAWLASHAVQLL